SDSLSLNFQNSKRTKTERINKNIDYNKSISQTDQKIAESSSKKTINEEHEENENQNQAKTRYNHGRKNKSKERKTYNTRQIRSSKVISITTNDEHDKE
ncbi:3095_t:CDS:1, partial [Scutellospora calospora]